MYGHFTSMKISRFEHILLYKKMNEYGRDNIEFEILEDNINDKELLYERESYWVEKLNTYFENNKYGLNSTPTGRGGYLHGERPLGEEHHNSKITNDKVYNIKKDFVDGMGRSKLKRIYSVDSDQLYNILSKKAWGTVGAEFNDLIDRKMIEDSNMMDTIKEEIRKLYIEGEFSIAELAEMYEYSSSNIRLIVKGLSIRRKDIKKDLVLNIKNDFLNGLSRIDIVDKYNVKQDFVYSILNLNYFVSVGEELNRGILDIIKKEQESKIELKNKSEREINLRSIKKLKTEDLVINIKKDFISGMTGKSIADKYGVKPMFVNRIVNLERHANTGEELNSLIIELAESKNKLIIKIKNDYIKGLGPNIISDKYNVSIGFVSGIVYLKNHIDVGEELNEKIIDIRNKNK